MISSSNIIIKEKNKQSSKNLEVQKIYVLGSNYDISPTIQILRSFGCHCEENIFNRFKYYQKGMLETQNFNNLQVFLDEKTLTLELENYFLEKQQIYRRKNGRLELMSELVYEWKRMFSNRYIVMECFKCKKNRRLYINRGGKLYMLPYETELEYLVYSIHNIDHLQYCEVEELLSSAGYGYPSFHSLIKIHIMKACNYCRY